MEKPNWNSTDNDHLAASAFTPLGFSCILWNTVVPWIPPLIMKSPASFSNEKAETTPSSTP